jgi:predicted deacetylase
MTATFAISIHDVAPATWPACVELLALLHPERLPATLLVVPHYHGGGAATADPAFVAAIDERRSAGDEVALHGFLHRDDARAARGPVEWLRRRHLTASEGEFAALDAAEAGRRLAAGLAEFESVCWRVRGFVPPAWLLGVDARRALASSPLQFTSTRDALVRIRDGARIPAPSLVWSTRSRWRRQASWIWNARRLAHLAGQPLVRLALHPADASYPDVMEAWRTAIRALAADRACVLEFAAVAAALGS